MPPTRFSPEALTGITGSARGAGPWTRHAPTYCAPFLSFVFTTSTMGSYWEPWQMQYTRSTSDTLTAVPAFVFHQRSAVGSVGGNFVYWIVSRISPVNLSGGGRI